MTAARVLTVRLPGNLQDHRFPSPYFLQAVAENVALRDNALNEFVRVELSF
jgi:hypothetical protein